MLVTLFFDTAIDKSCSGVHLYLPDSRRVLLEYTAVCHRLATVFKPIED